MTVSLSFAPLTGVLIVFNLLGSGCSNTVPSRPPDASSFADSYCEMFATCCAMASLATDGKACRALVAFASSSGSYDSALGSTCLADLEVAKAKPDSCATLAEVPSCDRVFGKTSGTLKPGERCTADNECAPSTEGKIDCYSVFTTGGGQTKTCMVQVKGMTGATPCVGTVRGAVTSFTWDSAKGPAPTRGYLCDYGNGSRCDSSSQGCVALKPTGASCIDSDECVSSAYCDFSSGKCKDKLPVGASCTQAAPPCEEGAYCDDGKQKCTARLAPNAACSAADQCLSQKCVNMLCASGSSNFALSLLCGK